ncbi:Acetylpolyamine aminohydrolase [Phytophthora megakarya]|uniref:Acetylpolyamine aminohydrolase n=1 Tax=Phytophthora megakarya TaxID=4795 RepID=A0A225UE36_9STRA|nr:Acetylpolyamine aminohydrolase [Phytophthora megakarya]
MRLHEGVWVFAEHHGNEYAREYATFRSNAEDAYANVATHVTDVLASAIGISRFELEPLSSDELPSAEFVKARMAKVFERSSFHSKKLNNNLVGLIWTSHGVAETPRRMGLRRSFSKTRSSEPDGLGLA